MHCSGKECFTLSKKVQALCYITIIVVALSLTAILYMLMPACSNCGRKFCFGNCVITYGDSGTPGNGSLRPSIPKSNQTTTRLTETELQDESYLDDIYFVGDSRTVALTAYGIAEERVFAKDGLNHLHALDEEVVRLAEDKMVTIPDAVMITAPQIMIVNFGINGAAYLSKEEFLEGYGTMIDTLIQSSPNSIIVIESILPVADFYEAKEGSVTNEEIDDLNAGLYQMAMDKGLYYLATNEAMKNENNDVNPDYTTDGLHYNQAGCEVILNYIRSHAILFQ